MIEYLTKKGERILLSELDNDLLSVNWYIGGPGYAQCASLPHDYLHRIVLQRKLNRELQPGEVTDHINGNKLDNRRENLRPATDSQNKMNAKNRCDSSGQYRGVYFDKLPGRRKRWVAYIRVGGKRKTVGYFLTEIEAATARDLAAKEHYGEFARLNNA